jgi:hypothetical protein
MGGEVTTAAKYSAPIQATSHILRQGVLRMLDIKDSDIRILALEQCRDAVDKGIHAGGAFSAVVPLRL